jgi:hypothetical protein
MTYIPIKWAAQSATTALLAGSKGRERGNDDKEEEEENEEDEEDEEGKSSDKVTVNTDRSPPAHVQPVSFSPARAPTSTPAVLSTPPAAPAPPAAAASGWSLSVAGTVETLLRYSLRYRAWAW